MAANKIGKRMFLDVASVHEHQNSVVVNSIKEQYWRIMVDEKFQFKISDF
jgi:hypothetical protein